MKLLTVIFVVVATNQVRAFTKTAADNGIQIELVSRIDDKPVEQALYEYAKFLEEINRKPTAVQSSINPAASDEMGKDQSTALCPTPNCTCNTTFLKVHGFIRSDDGVPTDNCTIHNVPYCEGVCSSTYR